MRAWTASLWPFAVAALIGCGPAREAGSDGDADADADGNGCVDLDGDGAGTGDGCSADDCDDTDPETSDQCGSSCESHPNRLGCPCPAGQVAACYHGPDGTGDIGGCVAGIQHCVDGVWGTCDGQALPQVEACNGDDDDCDGQIDDGVLSACGDCNVDCEASCVGVGCDVAFDPNQGRAVVQDATGALTLGGQSAITNHVIWIANSGEGTVSKVNTRTRIEEGRYITGPSGYPDPSRSTVNGNGDVVSVNRGEGSATRILASDCTDQNGDGLHTSSGSDDVLPWGEDDCVVWHLDGMPGARGSAVEHRSEFEAGIHEYVWVGSYDQGIIYEIDAEAGEFTDRQIPNVTPYGAALGPGGLLWTFGQFNSIVSIDTSTLEREEIAIPAGESWYGLTVDSQGRIWIGGSVARYDPATEEWESPGSMVSGGGIAVDGNDNAWVGEFGSAWFVDGETMESVSIPGAGGHGWAVDFDGYPWSIVWGWDAGGGGQAIVVDPETLEVDEVVDGFGAPYTYSDMTGFQLVNATNPVGVFPHIFEACEEGDSAHWSQLTCEVDAPAGTVISFRIRIADDAEGLPAAPWVSLASVPPGSCPVDVDDALAATGLGADEIDGRIAEVEATLESVNRGDRPILTSMGLYHSCEGIFQ